MRPTPDRHNDDVLAALNATLEAADRVREIAETIRDRAKAIAAMRDQGLPYREIVPLEERPLIVELLSESLEHLSAVGSQLRRAEAKVLYDEGLTMEDIAALFGVSRQRVAVLLRPRRAAPAAPAP
jgi:hypothetical protein